MMISGFVLIAVGLLPFYLVFKAKQVGIRPTLGTLAIASMVGFGGIQFGVILVLTATIRFLI